MRGFSSKTPLRTWLLGLAFINDTYSEIPAHPVAIWAKKMTIVLKSSVVDGRLRGALPVSAVIEGDVPVGTPGVFEDYDPARSVIMKAPRIEVTFRADGTLKRMRAGGVTDLLALVALAKTPSRHQQTPKAFWNGQRPHRLCGLFLLQPLKQSQG